MKVEFDILTDIEWTGMNFKWRKEISWPNKTFPDKITLLWRYSKFYFEIGFFLNKEGECINFNTSQIIGFEIEYFPCYQLSPKIGSKSKIWLDNGIQLKLDLLVNRRLEDWAIKKYEKIWKAFNQLKSGLMRLNDIKLLGNDLKIIYF